MNELVTGANHAESAGQREDVARRVSGSTGRSRLGRAQSDQTDQTALFTIDDALASQQSQPQPFTQRISESQLLGRGQGRCLSHLSGRQQ